MMRTLCLMLGAAALAGCTSVPPQQRSLAGEQHLQQLLAGKVAGASRSCLPSWQSSDRIVIDEDTVLFRDGSRRVWRTELPHPCRQLASGHYTLVTRSFGGQGLCRGDIVHLADSATGNIVGSCVWGDAVPYTAPRP